MHCNHVSIILGGIKAITHHHSRIFFIDNKNTLLSLEVYISTTKFYVFLKKNEGGERKEDG